jgi:hypothetical protein
MVGQRVLNHKRALLASAREMKLFPFDETSFLGKGG